MAMSTTNNPSALNLRIAGGQLLDARQAALDQEQRGVHRMEPVLEVNGVLYVNDSRSTFLDATLASIGSLDRRAVWITGAWSDELTEGLAQDLFQDRVSAVVIYGGQHEEHAYTDGGRIFLADDVRMAVFLAREIAKAGEAVLFSPACPSGNGFANYEERGAEFKRAVRDL